MLLIEVALWRRNLRETGGSGVKRKPIQTKRARHVPAVHERFDPWHRWRRDEDGGPATPCPHRCGVSRMRNGGAGEVGWFSRTGDGRRPGKTPDWWIRTLRGRSGVFDVITLNLNHACLFFRVEYLVGPTI